MAKRPTSVQNLSPNTSAGSETFNRDKTQSPFQKLSSAIDWIKKKEASTSKKSDKLYGIVLTSRAMPIVRFKEKYPEDTSFYKSVIQKNGKVIKPKKDSYIIKAHCYIPEVSGILPFPDYDLYNRYLCLYNGTEEPIRKENQTNSEYEKEYQEYRNRTEKEIQKIYPKLFKEFQKIVMHPVFYKYMESSEQPTAFQFVSVAYTEDFDTLHSGVIEDIHGAFFSGG